MRFTWHWKLNLRIGPLHLAGPSARHEISLRGLTAACVFCLAAPLFSQEEPARSQPYASIDRSGVSYRGPGREAVHDLPGNEVRIGMLVPLQGPRKREGEALLLAARLAVEDAAASPLPDGRRLALIWRDESGPWGRASSEIVRLVTEDKVVALLTSTDGGGAHLAQQVGNKLGVAILTLSSDPTTTQINIPWLFRLVPNDAAQAQAFADDIYKKRGLGKVLLVTEDSHDGRVGGAEFEKAAMRLNAPSPIRLEVPFPLDNAGPYAAAIGFQRPEAVVFWTGPDAAEHLLSSLQGMDSPAAVYLCQKAAQEPFARLREDLEKGDAWVAAWKESKDNAPRRSFEERFRERFGTRPSLAAAAAHDAVCLIAAAMRQSGPNRARLRDSLANFRDFAGVSGIISFDGAGNNQAAVVLIQVR